MMILTDICYPITKKNVYNSNNKKILEIPSVVIWAFAQTGKEFAAYFVQDRFLLAFGN